MITSLRLVNFKNFADETLRVGPFTVIVGANASGKSNKSETLSASSTASGAATRWLRFSAANTATAAMSSGRAYVALQWRSSDLSPSILISRPHLPCTWRSP